MTHIFLYKNLNDVLIFVINYSRLNSQKMEGIYIYMEK